MIDNNNNNGPFVSHDQRPNISLKDHRPKITYKGRQVQAGSNNAQSNSGFNAKTLSDKPDASSQLMDTLGGVVNKVKGDSASGAQSQGAAADSTQSSSNSQAADRLKAGVSRDTEVMNFVRSRDGQYLCEEGQFIRRGNTFIVTDGPMKDYKVVYKGGRNFQIRNPDGESLMIYHGPRRRPRIAPGEGEQQNAVKQPRSPNREPEEA